MLNELYRQDEDLGLEDEEDNLFSKLERIPCNSTGIERYVANILLNDNDNSETLEKNMEEIIIHGCESGACPSMIYYNQTNLFFDENSNEILEIKKDYEEMTGEHLEIKGDFKEFMSWFSFEYTVRQLADVLDVDY